MTKGNKSKNVSWIRVNSSLRGLAIYKADLFLQYNHDYLNL